MARKTKKSIPVTEGDEWDDGAVLEQMDQMAEEQDTLERQKQMAQDALERQNQMAEEQDALERQKRVRIKYHETPVIVVSGGRVVSAFATKEEAEEYILRVPFEKSRKFFFGTVQPVKVDVKVHCEL